MSHVWSATHSDRMACPGTNPILEGYAVIVAVLVVLVLLVF